MSFQEKLDLLNEIRQRDKIISLACEHLAKELCNNKEGLGCSMLHDKDCKKCWYDYLENKGKDHEA